MTDAALDPCARPAAPAGQGDDLRARLATMQAAHRAVGDEARAEALARQRARGKMTARERVAALADAGSFVEAGGLVRPRDQPDAPGDGVVVGTGRIDGRPVSIVANDFSVMGGSSGEAGARKTLRQTQLSLDHGIPYVSLLDGGGHRIQEGLDSRHFAAVSTNFQQLVDLSGWAPICAAMMGSGFAGPSNMSALADFVVMVKGATMGIAGPALVKAATGEDVDKETLGGAATQADRNGIADLAVEDDAAALDAIRRFLSYFPSNAGEPAPVLPCDDPADRREEALLDLVPANTRRAYDVRKVLAAVADQGSLFELKPGYARNVVTTLARLGGRPVGIVANQPLHLAGTLDAPACEKTAHFIALCDAFGLPLVFFVDIPGFLVGSPAERSALVRRSARIIHELGKATVPRLSVVLRKGYGLGFIAMNGGRSFGADLTVAWPGAEICAMSIEGATEVAYGREIAAAPDPDARRAELIAGFRARVGPLEAAEGFGVDDLIDPRDTRPVLVEALSRLASRRQGRARPPKHRDISPI
ncbi:acyl-CoA carboxylase subunit beta [Albimonas sp. CAU 1670]|uniref:acyl-CoA carboxylase subunit beta n=1 Tax=Albimonas sp. CAU 1670 TaxID=3032599 RepID=UPI0023DC94FA|nr:acyl-CoA carboxylase subunit beta [Albimonas sp. CAU 1670]MDF2231726.1 acyl-CoA carboxylase subunit beta [Albimonas sp. CAU 1670]